MLVGHVAVGLAAKRAAPKVSLGALVMAALLADLLWSAFLLAGIEHVEFKTGRGAANYVQAADVALSHSLITDAAWSGLLAAAYFARRRCPRGAWVLFAAGLSHWVLDWVSHRPDMPLAPGAHRYFGLGLWNSIGATVVVEGGLWICAIALYVGATHATKRAGVYAFWGGVAALTLAWYNNIAGPPPSDARAAGFTSFVFFTLIVAWAYWIDLLRAAQRG